MDGITDEFSAYPMTLEDATGGAEWGPWFDRLVGAWAQYRIIEQNDPVKNEGQPQYQPTSLNVSGSINTGTLLMLGGAALLAYMLLRGN